MSNDKYKEEKYDDYKNYVNRLSGEYKRTFEKVELYITDTTKLNFLEKNNCFLQILDTFLSAQQEEKAIEEITGSNLKRYCDDMIHGETIYDFKVSRICFNILGALFYISFMSFCMNLGNAIELKDSNIMFETINFGIAEIILAVMYFYTPRLTVLFISNYFENPVGYKRIRRYARCIELLFTCIVYTMIKINFPIYGVNISFNIVVLVLIYLFIASIVVWSITMGFSKEKSRDELLKKQYEKYKLRCAKVNKNPLDWGSYAKKKVKDNKLYVMLFSLYLVFFVAIAFFMARGMIINANIDLLGIAILVIIAFISVVIVSAIRLWIIESDNIAKL